MAVGTVRVAAHGGVRSEVERAALVGVVALALAGSLAAVVVRATGPADGTLAGGGGTVFAGDGVVVGPDPAAVGVAVAAPGAALGHGDVVVGIAGVPVATWADALLDPTRPRPALVPGDPLELVVRRDTSLATLEVTLGRTDVLAALGREWGVLVFALAMQLVGLALFVRRPDEPAVRALLVTGSAMWASTVPWAVGLQAMDLATAGPFWLYALEAGLAYSLIWCGLLHLALVFPRPRLVGRGRLLGLAYGLPLGMQALLVAVTAVGTGRGLAALDAWLVGQRLAAPLTLLAVSWLLLTTYRRADREGRQQLRWIGAAGIVVGLGSTLLWSGPELVLGAPLVPRNVVALLSLAFPVALVVAISRHHLFRLDGVVNRSVVYLGLTAGVVVAYALTVVVVSALLPGDAPYAVTLLGAAAAAAVALPLRDRLQRGIDRLMYGDRSDPARAVRRLGERLETTLDPRTVLPTVVATVAESLRSPYVAIELVREDGPVEGAAFGQRPATDEGLLALPIAYGGRGLGRLVVAPRALGERFRTADTELLADLARQVAPAVEALRLTTDLQRSREQLVTTREEERRRIRRELHDGLGPTLAATLMKLQAARSLAERDPDRSSALLDELEAATRGTIDDVRRIAYGLRPPTLDEYGLVGALRHHVASLAAAPDGAALEVTLDAPEDLRGLPAAVEVAAFRIALEALTNVLRHADARHARIALARTAGGLRVAVDDDGRGPGGGVPGVGLASMRERAEELGGTLVVEAADPTGTRVVADLPLEVPTP